MSLKMDIAKTIKKADSSYLFEDYTKQASAVLGMLEQQGYMILPREPKKDLFKEVADKMATGRMKPEEHIKDVYETILRIMAEQKL